MTRTTLKDVAAHAGVSHQTVSNVLNDHPSIRPETRARVLSSIQALDYHPNQAAKALREARVTTLCCAFFGHDPEQIGDPYRNLVQSAFIAEAQAHGYSVTTAFVNGGGATRATFDTLRQRFLQRQFGGAVIVGTTVTAEQHHTMRSWHLPAVLFDHHLPSPDAVGISADYHNGMQRLVDHHVQQGRRRLALILPPDDQGSTSVGRREGFEQACARASVHGRSVYGDWSYESGYAAMQALWADSDRPDAVLGGNDRMGTGALRAAHDLGISVPNDVSVSGFDDFEFAQFTTPSLTTVHIPHGDMARHAVRSLIQLLEGEPTQSRVFPLSLVVRESA
ncbi:LacI family transcriptional regulator [Deinococcus metalli]|uniref:LacI family transcriptional regulator n=1 Tax=Deinococcus metalli TaxID=1141878 RepID=A0A7W8KEM7_9DEIO|nr:LacI family DNA-binding transcriptional regulator [Deinococcus metalli]MBB5375698.1 LacI family transcriptional regulator [Deinococcus metalli]GHF37696.1 LacI family transcriptional regulator [Deinococcus metalli]